MEKLVRFAPRILMLGLSLMLLGFGMAGFSLENLDTHGPYEKKVFESDAPATSVLIEERYNDVVIAPSSDGKLRVTYYDSEKEYYKVGLDDAGRLTVRYISEMKWYEHWGISAKDTTVLVELPASSVTPLEVVSANGQVTVKDMHFASLQVKNTNGAVLVRGVQKGDSIYGVQVDDCIDISGVNGEIDLNGVSARAATVKTTNGEISLVNVSADQVGAQTTNGEIHLQGVDAGSGDYRTTNGSIWGDVVGASSEYTVESRTRLGSNRTPSGGSGPRKLRLETTNGGISVTFGRDRVPDAAVSLPDPLDPPSPARPRVPAAP